MVLSGSTGQFGARSATFKFAAGGKLARAELTGEPNGDVELKLRAQEHTRAGSAARAPLGVGPLAPDLRGGHAGRHDRAGAVRDPGSGLRAGSGLALERQRRREVPYGSLVAAGTAHARWRTSELWAPQIDLRYALDTQRGNALSVGTHGVTTASLALPQGEPLELRADEGLEARSTGGRLTFPLSRVVRLERKGEEAFQAAPWSATFRPATHSFTAEGDVSFEDASSEATAERIVSSSPTERSFYGPCAPPRAGRASIARTGDSQASAQAVEIHIHGGPDGGAGLGDRRA